MARSAGMAIVAGSLGVLTESAALLGYQYLGRTLGDLISSGALVLLAAVAYHTFRSRWPRPTFPPADVGLEFGTCLAPGCACSPICGRTRT